MPIAVKDRLCISVSASQPDLASIPSVFRGVAVNKRRVIRFIGSTEAVARDGMIIRVGGWRLQNYLANPVFLWAHSYGDLPVGRCIAINRDVDRGLLIFDIEFARAADYAFADTVFRLYRAGILNAVSVGFIVEDTTQPNAEESRGGCDLVVTRCDLLELSAVPVPADTGALVAGKAARAFEDADDLVKQGLRNVLSARYHRDGIEGLSTMPRDQARQWRKIVQDLKVNVERTMKRAELLTTDEGFEFSVRDVSLFDAESFEEVEFSADPQVMVVVGTLLESTAAPDGEGTPEQKAARMSGKVVQVAKFPGGAWTEEEAGAWVDENLQSLMDYKTEDADDSQPEADQDTDGDVVQEGEEPDATREEELAADAQALHDAADALQGLSEVVRAVAEDVDPASGEPSGDVPEPGDVAEEAMALNASAVRSLSRVVDRLTARSADSIRNLVRDEVARQVEPLVAELRKISAALGQRTVRRRVGRVMTPAAPTGDSGMLAELRRAAHGPTT